MQKIVSKNVGRRSTKPKRIFEKVVTIRLVGTSKDTLQKVARRIHSLSTDETAGGRLNRKVQMTHKSTEPEQIFFGRI